MNLKMTLIINTFLASLLVLITLWLPQLNMYMEKSSSHKCGFDAMWSVWLPFSMKFFLMAITFLLFDLEIVLLLPLPWASQSNHLTPMLVTALFLISLLALGLVYEWLQKGLEWTESDS